MARRAVEEPGVGDLRAAQQAEGQLAAFDSLIVGTLGQPKGEHTGHLQGQLRVHPQGHHRTVHNGHLVA